MVSSVEYKLVRSPLVTRFNRAVGFSLLAKGWQAVAGLLTIPLILHYLGAAKQGYYYTFSSLIAMQSFFELGFSIVISIYASHEWHQLRLDSTQRVVGDYQALSRLTSLGRFVIVYSALMALVYLLVVGPVGYHVLASEQSISVDWVLPWVTHVFFSALLMSGIPFLSLLEGCDQMADVALFRLIQSAVASLVLWVGLAAGLELWALTGYSLASVIMQFLYLVVWKRGFFSTFLRPPQGESLSWRNELLPMQWRLAVQGLFSYMSFPLFTSITYTYQGAVEAGRLGMTLQIISGIQSFALVFLRARAPEFSLLAAARDRLALVERCKWATVHCVIVMGVSCGLVVLALVIADVQGVLQTGRMLSPLAFLVFSIGIVGTGIVQGIALYMRAYKQELLTVTGVIVGCLYGVLGWQACIHFGSIGIAWTYSAATVFVAMPLSLFVLRVHRDRIQEDWS